MPPSSRHSMCPTTSFRNPVASSPSSWAALERSSTEGGSSATLNVGGGVNIWSGRGAALRIQVRGRYDTEYDEDTVALQLGVTF